MRAPVLAHGRIVNGKLLINQQVRAAFDDALSQQPDGAVLLMVGAAEEVRGLALNAYYHGVVLPIVSAVTGYTHDEAHEAMKRQFGVTSTRKLSHHRMREYTMQIQRFAAEGGLTADHSAVDIPDPREV